DHALPGELAILAHAVRLDDDDRRIGGFVREFLGLPDQLAGLLVEGGEGSLVAAGRADDLVAIDEGRLRVTPAGHHRAAEVGLEILGPDLFPRGRLDAENRPLAADAEDEVAVHRRRAARPVTVAFREERADLGGPQLLLRL